MRRLMAVFIVFASLPLVSVTARAQEEVVAGRTYELKLDIPIREVKIDGSDLDRPAPTIPSPIPPSQYTVIRMKGDSAIIRFWKYSDGTPENTAFNYDAARKTQRYFAAQRSVLSAASGPYYELSLVPSISAGAILIPIKMRSNPFDFSKDITLGPSIAFRWRTTNRVDQFVSLVGSFGLTSVQLDSASTEGHQRQPLDVSAVTPAVGMVYEVDNFQFGLFAGWDMISDNDRLKWRHQGKRWFSVGLGYSILSRTSTRQAVSGNQNR